MVCVSVGNVRADRRFDERVIVILRRIQASLWARKV